MTYRNPDGQLLIDFWEDNNLVYKPENVDETNKDIYLTLNDVQTKNEKEAELKEKYEEVAKNIYLRMLSSDNVLQAIENIWRNEKAYNINKIEEQLNNNTFEFEKCNEGLQRMYKVPLPHPIEIICCREGFPSMIKEKIIDTIQRIRENAIEWSNNIPNDNRQMFINYIKSKEYTLEQLEEIDETKILQSFFIEDIRGKSIFNLLIKDINTYDFKEYFKIIEKKRVLKWKISKLKDELWELEEQEEMRTEK